MTARHLHHWLCFVVCVVLAGAVLVLAQGTPLTLGPLTVTIPAGWFAQTNVVPIRLFSPDSTPQQYFQVEFLPQSHASSASNPGADSTAVSQPNVASAATLGEYVYAAPAGWTKSQYVDGIVLMSPASVTNERCVVTLWPMRPAGADLLGDASNIFQDVYKTYEPRNQTNRGTPMPQSVVRGTSGQGWDYVIVRRGIAPRGSPESRLGFVFVAKLNDRLAIISGVSRDPLVSTCFGELASNAWPAFFYSLSFKNWTPMTLTFMYASWCAMQG